MMITPGAFGKIFKRTGIVLRIFISVGLPKFLATPDPEISVLAELRQIFRAVPELHVLQWAEI